MGKGDKKTRRGKISKGTFGKHRTKKKSAAFQAVAKPEVKEEKKKKPVKKKAPKAKKEATKTEGKAKKETTEEKSDS